MRTLVVLAIVLVPLIRRRLPRQPGRLLLGVARDGRWRSSQGVPYDLPFGIHLYSSAYVTGLTAAQLPADRRKQLLDQKAALATTTRFDLARKLELNEVQGTAK